MTIYYVDSVNGSNTSAYDTWAKAATLLSTITAIDAAGDDIYVDGGHAGSTAGSITLAFAGTLPAPTWVICGDRTSGAPPTTPQTTASETSTGNTAISITGSCYIYGMKFDCGSGSVSSASILTLAGANGNAQVFDNCILKLSSTSGSCYILPGSAGSVPVLVRLLNTNIIFNAAAHTIHIGETNCRFEWLGGTFTNLTGNTTVVFKSNGGRVFDILVSGVDFSGTGVTTTMPLIDVTNTSGRAIFRRCKLPASWTGSPATGTFGSYPTRVEMHDCDSGNTNYKLWIEDYSGEIREEVVIVRTGNGSDGLPGASDGTTAWAIKMVSSANANYPYIGLQSQEIIGWNDDSGSSRTVTVEYVADSNVAGGQGAGTSYAFRNDELWLEVEYPGSSSSPLAGFATSRCLALATPGDNSSSSIDWTTTGLTTPKKGSVSVTFTPQQKGAFIARVVLAKASKTVYVDPKITISS